MTDAPEELTFQVSQRGTLALFVFGAVFVLGGGTLLASGAGGLAGGLVGTILIPTGLALLGLFTFAMRRTIVLQTSAEGVTYAGMMGKPWLVPWGDIEAFRVLGEGPVAQVAFRYRDPSRGLKGGGAFPGHFSFSAAEVVEQLNSRLERARREL